MRVPPGFALLRAVADVVWFIAIVHVRHTLPPQFDGLVVNLGVDGTQAFGDDVLGFWGRGCFGWTVQVPVESLPSRAGRG
jgi:hypothetical protein